tara:strand:+ start:242 stop:409 length:168 start_codon:yes stop_codon:yes gene_type:complete
VDVTDQLSGSPGNSHLTNAEMKIIFAECYKFTLSKNQFNNLLSKGVKVITSQNFS